MSADRDPSRYRPNVGIALFNREGKVFYGKRILKGDADTTYIWQFPQGGMDRGETPRIAALRELHEEIGVEPALVDIAEEAPDWIYYDFPPVVLTALGKRKKYLGQRQKWFAMRFLGADKDVRLDLHTPEFDDWRWGDLAAAPDLIVPFKRDAYQEVVRRFARYAQ